MLQASKLRKRMMKKLQGSSHPLRSLFVSTVQQREKTTLLIND